MDPKASDMGKRNIQPAPFLKRLPIEIRTEVYRNLLSSQYTQKLSISRQLPTHAKLWPGHTYHLDPTILRTNHQVHSEASTVLYHENLFVRVRSTNKSLPRLMTVKGIPIFLEGRNAETFKHCSMSVDFERLNTSPRVKSQENKPCYVIASTDVKLLCETFLIQHIVISGVFQHYEFRITIHRMFDDMLSKIPAENSPQRRLLEPFTVLHGIPHFRIAGPANTEYCAGIVAQVSRIGPTIGEYFVQVIELRDKGHENLSRNDVKGAIESYKMAYSLLISRCLRRNVIGPDWTGFYSELQGAVVDTYLALAANLAFSHFSLNE